MNVGKLIDILGGAQEMIKITGMTGGRISQMRSKNKMPKGWLMFFENKYPDAVHQANDQDAEERQKQTLICLHNGAMIVGLASSDNTFTRVEEAHEVKQSDVSIFEKIDSVLNKSAELKKITGSLKITNSSIDFSIDF